MIRRSTGRGRRGVAHPLPTAPRVSKGDRHHRQGVDNPAGAVPRAGAGPCTTRQRHSPQGVSFQCRQRVSFRCRLTLPSWNIALFIRGGGGGGAKLNIAIRVGVGGVGTEHRPFVRVGVGVSERNTALFSSVSAWDRRRGRRVALRCRGTAATAAPAVAALRPVSQHRPIQTARGRTPRDRVSIAGRRVPGKPAPRHERAMFGSEPFRADSPLNRAMFGRVAALRAPATMSSGRCDADGLWVREGLSTPCP